MRNRVTVRLGQCRFRALSGPPSLSVSLRPLPRFASLGLPLPTIYSSITKYDERGEMTAAQTTRSGPNLRLLRHAAARLRSAGWGQRPE